MDEKIRAAYEKMDPTLEQEERMLAALLAAQSEQAEPQLATDPADVAGEPSRKRAGFKAWMVAVPVAACLALGAVVIGIGNQDGSATLPTSTSSASVESPAVASQESATLAAPTGEKREDMGYTATPNSVNDADGVAGFADGVLAYEAGDAEIDPYFSFEPGNTEE